MLLQFEHPDRFISISDQNPSRYLDWSALIPMLCTSHPLWVESRVSRTCLQSLVGVAVLSSNMGTYCTSLNLSLTRQEVLCYPDLSSQERSWISLSLDNSSFTIAQLTDLTPSSMDISMHSDTSCVGSDIVSSLFTVTGYQKWEWNPKKYFSLQWAFGKWYSEMKFYSEQTMTNN